MGLLEGYVVRTHTTFKQAHDSRLTRVHTRLPLREREREMWVYTASVTFTLISVVALLERLMWFGATQRSSRATTVTDSGAHPLPSLSPLHVLFFVPIGPPIV